MNIAKPKQCLEVSIIQPSKLDDLLLVSLLTVIGQCWQYHVWVAEREVAVKEYEVRVGSPHPRKHRRNFERLNVRSLE